jgi:hypothetical protein
MKAYLSGPISGNPLSQRIFEMAEEKYAKMGYKVINPHRVCSPGADWHTCMRNDIIELMQCNTIIMLDGWKHSRGALLEHYIALNLDMQIIYDCDEIVPDYSGIIAASIFEATGCTFKQLKSLSRKREYVDARKLFFYFMKANTKLSLNGIGSYIGRKHSDVVHGLKSCRALLETDKVFREKFEKVQQLINLYHEQNNQQTNAYHSETCEAAEFQS